MDPVSEIRAGIRKKLIPDSVPGSKGKKTPDPDTQHCQNYNRIERLDESHLYPNLEVLGLTCPRPGIGHVPPAWEASTLEKSHPDSLLIAIRNIYI